MSDNRSLDLRKQFIDEIWEEISSLNGKELDDYLASIGLQPDELLQDYSIAMEAVVSASQRARFEEARRQVHQKKSANFGNVLSFDLARKKNILAAIKNYADRTSAMTIAARNQKIEDESDLDVFLEACLRLGVIDSDGNVSG